MILLTDNFKTGVICTHPLQRLFLASQDSGCVEPSHSPNAIWEQAASALQIQQQVQPTRLNLALESCKNKPLENQVHSWQNTKWKLLVSKLAIVS